MKKHTSIMFRNIGYLSAAQILSSIFGFVTLTVLSRALGPANFGILGFGAALLSLLGILTTLGSDQYGAREIARSPHMVGAITMRLLIIRIVLATMAFGILLVFDALNSRGPLESRVLLIQGLGVFVIAFTLDYLFQGLSRMTWIACRQIITAGFVMFACYFVVHEPEHLTLAAWIYFIASASVVFIIFSKGIQIITESRLHGLSLSWRKILSPMVMMAITGTMQAIILNTDLIMLGIMRSNEEVGLYSAAVRIGMLVLIPAGLVIASLFPELAKNSDNIEDRHRGGRRYTTILLFLGVPFPCLVIAMPSSLISVVFGNDFLQSASVLSLMMVTTLLAHLRLTLDTPLVAWQFERQIMILTIIGATANVILNTALIPVFGMTGAVSASLISQIIMTTGCSYVYLSHVNSLPLKELTRVGLCSALALIITILGVEAIDLKNFPALFQLFIGTSIFFVGYLSFGYFLVWRGLHQLLTSYR